MAIKARSLGSAGSAVDMINITGSTNTTPIVITVAANSGLKNTDRLAIAGITGNTAANGVWELAALTPTTFQLVGSVGNGTHGGTPRAAIAYDHTPLIKGHSAALQISGNLVGTLTLTAFASYAEFVANDNSLSGSVPAPIVSSSVQGVTNTNATAASTSTKATSVLAIAATNQCGEYEVVLPRYLHGSITAYTSGTCSVVVAA